MKRDIVVIGASAGGIEALRDVLAGLPGSYPGSIFVVLHVPDGAGGVLAEILSRASSLEVSSAVDDEPILPGRVYVAVGGHHLLLGEGRILTRRGPRENGLRPAADPLFRSAAWYYGPRVVGVILSGTLSDGTAGLRDVRRQGGIGIVQDPADAMYEGMPTSALDSGGADHVVAAQRHRSAAPAARVRRDRGRTANR